MLKKTAGWKKIALAIFLSVALLLLAACAEQPAGEVLNTATVSPFLATPVVPEGPLRLHVATYNILHGTMVNFDFVRLGTLLAQLNLDVIGLQEVDQKTQRIGNQDALAEMAKASGCPYYAMAKAIDLDGGEYGVAVLSRYEIVSFETVPLYSLGTEQRVLGHAVLRMGEQLVDFFVTHLTVGRNTNIRPKQLEEIAQELRKTEKYIITGDFNTSAYQEFEVFPGAKPLNNYEQYFETFYPYHLGPDNIILSPGWRGHSVAMEEVEYSDHYLLHAVVEET